MIPDKLGLSNSSTKVTDRDRSVLANFLEYFPSDDSETNRPLQRMSSFSKSMGDDSAVCVSSFDKVLGMSEFFLPTKL